MADAPPSPPPAEQPFGQVALQLGLITSEQLRECVEIQDKSKRAGIPPRRMGELLILQGHLSTEQAEKVSRAMAQSRIQIPGYEILDKIGQGGMGAVYKARQVRMDRLVALKVLPPKMAKDRDFIERFVREAKAAARLNHTNIVAGIDAGEANGQYFLAMEYVEGTSLQKIIKAQGRLPERRAAELALQVARALDHAHRQNFVHRDIKPENILVAADGTAKLCDLGLAKREKGEDPSLTQSGMSVGTPHYISPEQARGEPNVDTRSDLYSLGATLYHMVTGEVPFTGATAAVVMTKHVTDPPVPPRQKNPVLSEGINAVVLKMLAKRRDDRYPTPAALAEDLERLLRGEPVQGRAPAFVPQAAAAGSSGLPRRETGTRLQVTTVRGHERPPSMTRIGASHRKGPSAGPLIAAGLAVAAGLGILLMMPGGGSTPAPDGAGASRPPASAGPAPGLPAAAESPRDVQARERVRSLAGEVTGRLGDPKRVEEFARRVEETMKAAEGTAAEGEARALREKFLQDVESLAAAGWEEMVRELDALEKAGKFREALDLCRAFPAGLQSVPFASPVPTGTGRKVSERKSSIERRRGEAVAEAGREIRRLAREGSFDAAWRRAREVRDILAAGGEVLFADVLREILEKEVKDLLASGRIDDARAVLTRRAAGPQAATLADAVRGLTAAIEASRTELSGKDRMEVEKLYSKMEIPWRKAVQSRDYAGARKLVAGLLYDPAHARFHPFTRVAGVDYAKLEPLVREGAGPFAAGETMLETTLKGLPADAPETARSLLLDAYALVLIEGVYLQVTKGLASAAQSQEPMSLRMSGDTAYRAERAADGTYNLIDAAQGKISQETFLTLLKPEDVLFLAGRGAGTESQRHPRVRMGFGLIRFFGFRGSEGPIGAEATRREFDAAAAGGIPGADRYAGELRSVASEQDEGEAQRLYQELFRQKDVRRIEALGDQLVTRYAETALLKAVDPPSGKTRLQLVVDRIRALRQQADAGAGAPRKGPFRGAAVPQADGTWRVTYDFSDRAQLEDFTPTGYPLGNLEGQGTGEVQNGRLVLRAATLFGLEWQAPLSGDVTAAMTVRSPAPRNLGVIFYSDETNPFTAGDGVYALLTSAVLIRPGGREQVLPTPNLIFAPPLLTPQGAISTERSNLRLQPNTDHRLEFARTGNSLRIYLDRQPVAEANHDGFHSGKTSVFLWRSEFIIDDLVLTGKVDGNWLKTRN